MRPQLFSDGIARKSEDGRWHLMNKPEPAHGWSTNSIPYASLEELIASWAVVVGELRRDEHGAFVELRRVDDEVRADMDARQAALARRFQAEVALEVAEAAELAHKLRGNPLPKRLVRTRAALAQAIQHARQASSFVEEGNRGLLREFVRRAVNSLLDALV